MKFTIHITIDFLFKNYANCINIAFSIDDSNVNLNTVQTAIRSINAWVVLSASVTIKGKQIVMRSNRNTKFQIFYSENTKWDIIVANSQVKFVHGYKVMYFCVASIYSQLPVFPFFTARKHDTLARVGRTGMNLTRKWRVKKRYVIYEFIF